jgi:hypothetical protein
MGKGHFFPGRSAPKLLAASQQGKRIHIENP